MRGCTIYIYSVQRIYIVPLKGNHSEAVPAKARANRSLKEFVKRNWTDFVKRAQFRWETVSGRESPICCLMAFASMWYHKVTSGGRAERLSARTGQVRVKSSSR